jgi:riboflavin synthase
VVVKMVTVGDPVQLLEAGAVRREELAQLYGRRAQKYAQQAEAMRQTADELRRLSGKEGRNGNQG